MFEITSLVWTMVWFGMFAVAKGEWPSAPMVGLELYIVASCLSVFHKDFLC